MTNQNKLYLEKLKYEDTKRFSSWRGFDEPLFYGYSYNDMTEDQADYWYIIKQRNNFASYFSINLDDEMIGFIGIKEIKPIIRSGKLGIVIDDKWTSKGYGKEAMKLFLDHYFKEMKMRTLILEVNAWNDRAIRLYKAFNFKIYKEKYEVFENQALDLEDEKYKDIKKHFRINKGKIESKIYFMRLSREEYINETWVAKRSIRFRRHSNRKYVYKYSHG